MVHSVNDWSGYEARGREARGVVQVNDVAIVHRIGNGPKRVIRGFKIREDFSLQGPLRLGIEKTKLSRNSRVSCCVNNDVNSLLLQPLCEAAHKQLCSSVPDRRNWNEGRGNQRNSHVTP